MDQPVVPFDLARILLGEAEWLFLLEIAARTIVVYLYTLALIRWIGGRTVAQLSMVEFLLVIALGSAVGDALFYPDVPLLPAMTAITAVVLLNKGIDRAILRFSRAKRLVDGMPRLAVTEGRILVPALSRDGLGVEEFLAQLRVKGVANLGEVAAAWIEADGAVSLARTAPPRPGLPIMPPHELSPPAALTDIALAPEGTACCTLCGGLSPAAAVLPDGACPECGSRGWTRPETAEAGGGRGGATGED